MKKQLSNPRRQRSPKKRMPGFLCMAAACMIVCAVLSMVAPAKGEMISLNKGIADSVLRFHIIANSDSDEDQHLKLKVRTAVTKVMSQKMSKEGISTKKDAENYVKSNMNEYIDIAKKVISQEGFDYNVKAKVGKCWFPVKVYGKYVFPEGDYDAFRIILGKGEGHNWWCVLFPSLCMVDESYQITEQSPECVSTALPETQTENIKIKFRIVEWLEDMW